MIVEQTDPSAPAPRALLDQHHALMNSLFPAGACHYLDLEALQQPHVTFLSARDGADLLGVGAIAAMDGYGEVKSMFTDPAARGRGAADAILRYIEDIAIEAALLSLKLETGTGLDAAHRLYERHGFTACGPFGSYEASPFSLFYEKALR